MKITEIWLAKRSACVEGVKWFLKQKETNGVEVVEKLIKENRLSWAAWTIVRLMSHKQQCQYAVFAAEQVISIFEKEYPDDKRPRQAIEAAKKYIENPSEENKDAAADAAYAAADAAYATYAAYAVDAANAANAAAYAVDAANAANAATYAVDAANAILKIKILEYGITLLKEIL